MKKQDDEYRVLKADEINCRAQIVKEHGFSLLLYKDARCDMAILDETYGRFNWQRKHTRDNKNCTIEVWDSDKAQWVGKEDVGTESYSEKEKGLASDSFKRAGFNWGIGRELYTAPFIWIKPKNGEVYEKGNKYKLNRKAYFYVDEIEYDEDRQITKLVIKDKDDNVRFTHGNGKAKTNGTQKKTNNSSKTKKSKTKKTNGTANKSNGEAESSNGQDYRQHIINCDNTEELIKWWKDAKSEVDGKTTMNLEDEKEVTYKELMAEKLDELEN